MPKRLVIFRCEASPLIGVGHAMRCSVLADALVEQDWECLFVTSAESYSFIPNLSHFKRLDPEEFYKDPIKHDLLVIDHYDLDQDYEKHFRLHAGKILVIDDLANRSHDCDILLDQTYGRSAEDYKKLVPENCEILVGTDYALLRPEFAELRPKALEKRHSTKNIQRILVSMGGSDFKNYTLKALEMIKEAGFKGAIDIVLGFSAPHLQVIEDYIDKLPNKVTIHQNAQNMAELIYEADLAIGAAGSSVWERCCLGLPSVLMITADNQEKISKLFNKDIDSFKELYEKFTQDYFTFFKKSLLLIDGLGSIRMTNLLSQTKDKLSRIVFHRRATKEDLKTIYYWQQDPSIRKYSFNTSAPSFEEHEKWFNKKIQDQNCLFEIIYCNSLACGALRMDYQLKDNSYLLSWYVDAKFQNCGIGTIVLNFSKRLASNHKIDAFVFKNNIGSQRALEKAGFKTQFQNDVGINYVF